MRVLSLVLMLSVAGSCVVLPPPAPVAVAGPVVDAPPFHDELAPHGDWWWHDERGWVWSPYVDAGWRPYTIGRWVWTSDGWLWASAEPFGWACHHYGRWLWLDDAGWIWVPGRVWAPAWVVWRHGPGYVGWAALGPDAVWVPGRGFVVVDVEVGIGPWGWVFVDEPDFLAVDVVRVVHGHARNAAILPTTRVIHRPERGDAGRVMNPGVEPDVIARATGKPVTARTIERSNASERAEPAGVEGAVRVRRAPDIERDVGDGDVVPRASAAPRAPRELEVRPLRAPDDDDVEGRFDDERRRALQRHEDERKAPAVKQDDLRQRQQRELEEMEKAKAKQKAARDKKKIVPRKVYPKKKPTPTKSG